MEKLTEEEWKFFRKLDKSISKMPFKGTEPDLISILDYIKKKTLKQFGQCDINNPVIEGLTLTKHYKIYFKYNKWCLISFSLKNPTKPMLIPGDLAQLSE